MDKMRETLEAGLPALGLNLTEKQKQTLCDFGAAVVKQNEVMNLTAITEPVKVAQLHLLDSLSVLSALPLAGKRVIDVGCGAQQGATHCLGDDRVPHGCSAEASRYR